MIDYYLKAPTEADMNEALDVAGLIVETQVGQTEDGEPIFTMVPTPGVSIDTIGPITRVTGYDENGDPITVEYPEWHVNVRCPHEVEGLDAYAIVPPEQPFRVWA